jgi:hypothetical protein
VQFFRSCKLPRERRDVGKMVRTASEACVELEASPALPALAYVLSEPPQPEERNPEYAAKLRALAERIGLPNEYVASIG